MQIRLHLTQKTEQDRRVMWREDTVDNEGLNKRSSKSLSDPFLDKKESSLSHFCAASATVLWLSQVLP
jgi:hypothetical protein